MKILKLKDGTTYNLYDENSGQTFQIKISSISEWESMSSHFTDDNFTLYEVIEEEYTYVYTDQKVRSFNISYTSETGYLVTIVVTKPTISDIKIQSIEEKINNVMMMLLNM